MGKETNKKLLQLIISVKTNYLNCNNIEIKKKVGLIMSGGEQID